MTQQALFSKIYVLTICIVLAGGTSRLIAQELRLQGQMKEQIAPPEFREQRDAWLDSLKTWRTVTAAKPGFDRSQYGLKSNAWIRHTFIYAQMMAQDRYFFDPISGRYTVGRYLDDLKKRYGGLDAVLIWPTYPNIGIDNRNQFDMLADMPGGKEGIRQMIADFHKRGVRVFFPIMIWDHGTRPVSEPMSTALIKEMKELGADGLNGDTMNGVSRDFFEASQKWRYPLALQPENNLSDLNMLGWNLLSWGYYFPGWGKQNYPFKPGVSLYKWLEPRHQVQLTDRWARNKTDNLQYAFFNGIGYNSWENVWGVWNQISERHAEEIRRIAHIYRSFPDIWSSRDWEPYFPTNTDGVFASRFTLPAESIITLVNRDSVPKPQVNIKLLFKKNQRFYDLWNGRALTSTRLGKYNVVTLNMEKEGFGALLTTSHSHRRAALQSYLQKKPVVAIKPQAMYSAEWKPLPQKMTQIARTPYADKVPPGMVFVKADTAYRFETKAVMIEGDELPDGVGVQYPWESHPQRKHSHMMPVKSFYIDQYCVSNGQFKKFLDVTGYRPADAHNFLKSWKNGRFLPAEANAPVTWVSLEDARAYARWTGKRLPHEWEWQYAAQGTDGRKYPWGDTIDLALMPMPDTSRAMNRPAPRIELAIAESPFHVRDLVGHVWQWTDEYVDEHTRSAVLKGGSSYRPQTSNWYFPQALELSQHAKYLLLSPGMDRAATLGFRCVKDLL